MQPLTLQLRHDDDEAIECWDDDGDLQCNEDIQFRTVSRATSVTNSSARPSGHRDSISSRRSARSDLDSNAGGDEDWQVLLHESDDLVNDRAFASARGAGIPLPANVPKSALVGGTIKRLGRKKPNRVFADDWAEDLELPNSDSVLELKYPLEPGFPESLGQISSAGASPVKPSSPLQDDNISPWPSALTSLSDFRLEGDSSDMQDMSTIEIAKLRTQPRETPISDSGPNNADVENLDDDFEFPAEDVPLHLPPRKARRTTPSPTPEEFDVDWCEGSIGIRFGGTTRDRPSNTSSSMSVVSPSASSCLSMSDDDGLDGLVIPEGPLALKKRQDAAPGAASTHSVKSQTGHSPTYPDDFFSGIEVEGDDVFTGAKRSLNPNVKCKTERPCSPARRPETAVTFTKSTGSPKTRIPRPTNHIHSHSTHLETVSEGGAPPPKPGDLRPHLGENPLHPSTSKPPLSNPTTSTNRLTLNRRQTGARSLKAAVADEPVAGTSRHPLKTKRSMPTICNSHSAASTELPVYSPSRNDGLGRSLAVYNTRSFTPADRIGNSMRSLNRRQLAPFIPAGATGNRSHHVSVKNHRHSARANSDNTSPLSNAQGSSFRTARLNRKEPIGNIPGETFPELGLSATNRTITRPSFRQKFGDGTELESFDDLPTSSQSESRFVKNPAGRGIPRSLRSRLNLSQGNQQPTEPPAEPTTPVSVAKPPDFTPRFARDTNASRNAREQRISSMNTNIKSREGNPLMSLSTSRRSQANTRGSSGSTSARSRKGKLPISPGSKPHLIKPIGTGVQEAKCKSLPSFDSFSETDLSTVAVNGMRYNPTAFRWEGNETSIQGFDFASSKSLKPAPALITNVGAMQNVRVVGGMVFDPRRMCWRKMAPSQPGSNDLVAVQDEDDVFAGLGDLEEKAPDSTLSVRNSDMFDDPPLPSGDDRSGEESSEEWPITEEFDVGPEFVRRQRTEEEKWRRKVDKWIGFDRAKFGNGWRWTIRDLVRFNGNVSPP